MFSLRSRTRAFTLIELLIVITIIGILAVALLPRITGATAKARDAQRKTDTQAIATALEQYASDNGGYPNTTGCISGLSLGNYMTTIPTDPSSNPTSTIVTGGCASTGTGGYGYVALNTNTTNTYAEGYLLFADLESTTDLGAGIYYLSGATAFSPTTTGTSATASSNLSTALACTSSSVCTSSMNRYYMIGR